jgi:hypothetical protein
MTQCLTPNECAAVMMGATVLGHCAATVWNLSSSVPPHQEQTSEASCYRKDGIGDAPPVALAFRWKHGFRLANWVSNFIIQDEITKQLRHGGSPFEKSFGRKGMSHEKIIIFKHQRDSPQVTPRPPFPRASTPDQFALAQLCLSSFRQSIR